MPKISKRSIDELIASGASGDVIRDDGVKGFRARLNEDVRSVIWSSTGQVEDGGFPLRRPFSACMVTDAGSSEKFAKKKLA